MAVHLFLLLPHVRLEENSERCDGCLYSDVDERNADCLNTSISELSPPRGIHGGRTRLKNVL